MTTQAQTPAQVEQLFPVSDAALVRWWKAELCRCGLKKATRRQVCLSCYFALPEKLRARNLLHPRLDDPDFYVAYRDALVWLNAIGRIRKVRK